MFTEEIAKYIDENNLIGNCENPSVGTSGNPLVLAGVYSVICKTNRAYDFNVHSKIDAGVASLRSTFVNGMWNHKANSMDQTTHDDLIGLVCYSTLFIKPYHYDILRFGYKNNWVMSNTSKFYWTAWAKPWHKAFYQTCADEPISFLQRIILKAFLYADTLSKDNSGHQLVWLMVSALELADQRFNSICKYWRSKVDMGKVIKEYHGENHPFYKYFTR